MAKIFLSLMMGGPRHDIRSLPAARSAAVVAWPTATQRITR
ncbi:hypothetical protein SGUI_2155 [Serinicoccus hydrothermalis]|uniref:Uncharacterized protein n=1 Tax=Serinicoccus hydrothermalis TaxID=1758689 RepID=A0A1B1NDT7_9MICO|nr:hypothetical protein [Serinicoccus hydrothermalis]ANS79551.1 hypothetical protein SGUI_2155 [Serinicoccus hydrothermalis]